MRNEKGVIRRFIFRAYFVTGCWVLYTLTAWAGTDSGADFLKIPIGAEITALGQAYTAVAEGVSSLNWNPAGLSRAPSHQRRSSSLLSFSHQEHFLNSDLDHFGLVFPRAISNKTNLGLNIIRLSYGSQDGRGSAREITSSFDAYDMVVGAAFARDFGAFQAGAQVNYIRQSLAGAQAQGGAVDFGFLAKSPWRGLSIGGAVQHLGPKMKFVDEEYHLPLTFALGAAFHSIGPLTISADVRQRPYQNQLSFSIGTAIQTTQALVLRAGYLTKLAGALQASQQQEDSKSTLSSLSGFNAGMGLTFPRFGLDYAISPFGELGNVQTLTVSTWFGGESVQSRIPPFDKIDSDIEVENKGSTSAPVIYFLLLPIEQESWWTQLKP